MIGAFLVNLIQPRVRVYLLGALLLAAAFAGAYWQGGRKALLRAEAERDKRRLDALNRKREIEKDVLDKDRDSLVDGIFRP